MNIYLRKGKETSWENDIILDDNVFGFTVPISLPLSEKMDTVFPKLTKLDWDPAQEHNKPFFLKSCTYFTANVVLHLHNIFIIGLLHFKALVSLTKLLSRQLINAAHLQ